MQHVGVLQQQTPETSEKGVASTHNGPHKLGKRERESEKQVSVEDNNGSNHFHD
jgi:hypothetical protein